MQQDSPRRALVVDDNEVNLMILNALLKKYGFDVVQAGSGDQALELLEAQCFDLVMLDCQMPDVDGYTVAREYRSRSGRATPIVGHSADWSRKNQERCLDAGMDSFLPKPCDRMTLEEILKIHSLYK